MANRNSFDVIIVGAGIAGITIASHLPKKLKIAIIEKGNNSYDIKHNSHNYGDCKYLGNFPTKNYSANFTSIKAIGGNSNIWSGWSIPMSKNELINWPIGYKEITRFYKQTETYLNLDSFNRLNSQKIFLKKYKKKKLGY